MGMWFEGETTPAQVAQVVRDCLLTPDPSLTPPAPLWEMVSSNVGTTTADNGYVFYSVGSSGTDKIYIGVKNAYVAAGAWSRGHAFFICENYTPGAAGTNGVISTEIREGLRYHQDESNAGIGIAETTLRMKYGIRVSKDRVIITIRTSVPGISATRSVLYMGLIKRYSIERDSSAMTIASTHGVINIDYNTIRLLRDGAGNAAVRYVVTNNEEVQTTYNGFGRRFMAVNLPVSKSNEGVRGELDGLLTCQYKKNSDGPGRNVPEDGTVIIGGKRYLCLVKPYNQYSTQDQFATQNGFDTCYFIPKE